jgi:uncharacterized coiled-coil protein SlyX
MTAAEIFGVVAGSFGILVTIGGAIIAVAMYAGGEKAKRSALDKRIEALETRLTGHDDNTLLLAKLEERLSNLHAALERQPQLIAQVVAMAIRETLRAKAA